MIPTRTLPLALLAALAALVSGCAEELVDTGSEPIVGESADTGLALAADGSGDDTLPVWEGDTLPPWEGEGPPPWAEEDPGKTPDSIPHPTRARIELTISATGPLSPNAGVALTVEGVAREPIDSGEVVLTLPTRALMDHALDTGVPDLPVKARWDLPPMAKGDTWSGSYTVAGEAAGYYRATVNAYTHGPDGGTWLFDDALGEAWMYVSETGGQLTRFFEESLFPDSVHPMAGPAAGWPTGPLARSPDYVGLHPDSIYLHLVYTVSERQGFRNAVGAEVRSGTGWWQTVPDDGIVSFSCRLHAGDARAPDNYLAQGRKEIAFWAAGASHCGKMVQVEVKAHKYLPWRLLNLAADTLQRHFGEFRKKIDWKLRFDGGVSYYNPIPLVDKITLGWLPASERFFFTVAHEYGHALHEKALGGMWWPGDKAWDYWEWDCFSHQLYDVINHRCALQEGFAHYAGTIGAGGYRRECFEHFGDPRFPMSEENKRQERTCRRAPSRTGDRQRVEGHVAALFLDLTDGTEEEGDYTEYSGYYVGEVFETCRVKNRYQLTPKIWKIPATHFYIWWKRTNVSNIVWCLEKEVTEQLHDEVFPDIRTPVEVSVSDHDDPPDWSVADIRRTWRHNLWRPNR